jgi:hypothetical protein
MNDQNDLPIILSLDREGTQIITDSIDFGIVKAGETISKSIFMTNKVFFSVDYVLTLTGEDIDIQKKQGTIQVGKTEEIIWTISPKKRPKKAIKGKLHIGLKWVVS